jgi:hypothetical protein
MELAMLGRRFLYFPLGRHIEQELHVARRLERHGVGRRLDYAATDEATLAARMLEELVRPVPAPLPLDRGTGARIAARIAALVRRR